VRNALSEMIEETLKSFSLYSLQLRTAGAGSTRRLVLGLVVRIRERHVEVLKLLK
jgi:hypothetical protein